MNCPNCAAPRLRTIETYQTSETTWRTKKCGSCSWKFTSQEVIADDVVIPEAVRALKRKPGKSGD